MTRLRPSYRAAPVALAAVFMMTVASAFSPAHAQRSVESLEGRVVLDGVGVPGTELSLHRVTPDSSGIQQTARSGAEGIFSFSLPEPDTVGFTVYFVTADHLGVRYFGAPVHPGDSPGEYLVQVRDTTARSGDDLRVARRDLVLLPHADGGWEVNEVVRLRNTGSRTIVSASGMPTWTMDLPAGADEFEAGAGDLATDQIQRMGDRMLLMAPLVPGEREIFLRYRMANRPGVRLAAGTRMDSLNVFIRQPAPRVTISGLRPIEIVTVEGQRFLHLTGSGLDDDATLQMEWERPGLPVDPVWAGVGAAVLVVLIGAGAAVRNRPV